VLSGSTTHSRPRAVTRLPGEKPTSVPSRTEYICVLTDLRQPVLIGAQPNHHGRSGITSWRLMGHGWLALSLWGR
jgi:hypothetical protein